MQQNHHHQWQVWMCKSPEHLLLSHSSEKYTLQDIYITLKTWEIQSTKRDIWFTESKKYMRQNHHHQRQVWMCKSSERRPPPLLPPFLAIRSLKLQKVTTAKPSGISSSKILWRPDIWSKSYDKISALHHSFGEKFYSCERYLNLYT